MKLLLLVVGLLLLIAIEILRVYFIMPFPGSQEDETLQIAYLIHTNILFVRLAGWAIVIYPALYYFRTGKKLIKIILAVGFGFYAVVFYMFNFRFLADQMFLQPKTTSYLNPERSKVLPKQLVLGVTINSESKAYPIEVIGYHHQVRDVVGGEPIMVTYCTVCRTGRVYSPAIAGKEETFRLVGMDHYNAMFEDSQTKSWWRQVSGEAVAGPLKGKVLKEIESHQMTLAEWINLHPTTTILQPDSTFKADYKGLEDYDEGKRKGRLERKDSLSWNDKSWIVGIQLGMEARAYDWNELMKRRALNDVLNGVPILITLAADSASFYSFGRVIDGDTLSFEAENNFTQLKDTNTHSSWSWQGQCTDGVLKGRSLVPVQSYQEYWHSWKTFHAQTTRYNP